MDGLTSSARVRMLHGTRLHWCAQRQTPYLLVPERALELTPTAYAVLALVDGRNSIGDIAAKLAAEYDASQPHIERDVMALLHPLISDRSLDCGDNASCGHTATASKTAIQSPKMSEATPRHRQASSSAPRPIAMLAELTHRCPLSCLYCSNPVQLTRRSSELETEEWGRVFDQAVQLGVLQVHLSGGEPGARRDLAELVEAASKSGLYTNLITSGVGLKPDTIDACIDAGLDHIQLSVQAADEATSKAVSRRSGALALKKRVADQVVSRGLPLTVNAVVHRCNIHQSQDLVSLALEWGARRIEIAHAQYHGWALLNAEALKPNLDQVITATSVVEHARRELAGVLAIDYVKPDHFARYPKACMGGWGRVGLNITPDGKVLPCHAAETIPGIVADTVREMSLEDIWFWGAAFQMFRGTSWMQEPCRSCPRQELDFGGCRCQAFALTGDAAAADPTCELVSGGAAVAFLEDAAPSNKHPIYRSMSRKPG